MAKKVDDALRNEQASDILGFKLGSPTDSFELASSIVLDEEQLQRTRKNQPSMSDKLTSLPAILTGIAALAGAVSNRPDISAGLLSGFLGQANTDIEREQRAHEKQIDIEAGDIASKRAALNQVFQANPEAFLDSNGKQTIDESLLGYALTGQPIAVSAGTRWSLKTMNNTKLEQLDLVRTAFTNAVDPAGRKEALKRWGAIVGMDMDETSLDSLAGHKDLSGFFLDLIGRADGNTVLDAMLKASTMGVRDMYDPRFTEVMAGVTSTPKTQSGQVPDKWEEAGDMITAWLWEDPATIHTKLKMSALDQAQAALHARPDLLMEFKNRYDEQLSEDTPMTLQEYVGLYNDLTVKLLAAGNFNADLVNKLTDPMWARNFLEANVNNTVTNLINERKLKRAEEFLPLLNYALDLMPLYDIVLGEDDLASLRDNLYEITGSDLSTEAAHKVIDNWYERRVGATTGE